MVRNKITSYCMQLTSLILVQVGSNQLEPYKALNRFKASASCWCFFLVLIPDNNSVWFEY